MEWIKHVPRLPEGTLIKFRQGDLVGDMKEREFRVLNVLGKGQNVVYKCIPVHHAPVATTSSSASTTAATPSSPSPHPLSSSSSAARRDTSLLMASAGHPDPLPFATSTSTSTAAPPSGSCSTSSPLKRKSEPERKGKSGQFKKRASRPVKVEAKEEPKEKVEDGPKDELREEVLDEPREETMEETKDEISPSSTFAIKVQYFKASDYKKDRALKGVWTEYSLMQDLGEVATKAFMCGWIMVKIPGDDLWTVGLFAGLVMPVYEPLRFEGDANETKTLVLDAFQQLRRFHQAGYVHGDVKIDNFLVKEGKVVVADVEGCCKEGQPLKDFVATPSYASISTLGHFLGCSDETAASVVAIIPTAANKGMDYWSFGIMILEVYCPQYLRVHFPIEDLVDKLREKIKDELEVLEKIRQAYTKIYDDHAWEKDVIDVHEDIKQLLRFCLQRPSNCGLLGRDAIDAEVSSAIALPVSGTADLTKNNATGGIGKLYSERRAEAKNQQPEGLSFRLPWGGCTLTATGKNQYTVEVPGIFEEEDDWGEAEWVFTACPMQHCQGFKTDRRLRYSCGKCKWTGYAWDRVQSHVRTCCGLGCRKGQVLGE